MTKKIVLMMMINKKDQNTFFIQNQNTRIFVHMAQYTLPFCITINISLFCPPHTFRFVFFTTNTQPCNLKLRFSNACIAGLHYLWYSIHAVAQSIYLLFICAPVYINIGSQYLHESGLITDDKNFTKIVNKLVSVVP